jgi:hypothetical protein
VDPLSLIAAATAAINVVERLMRAATALHDKGLIGTDDLAKLQKMLDEAKSSGVKSDNAIDAAAAAAQARIDAAGG